MAQLEKNIWIFNPESCMQYEEHQKKEKLSKSYSEHSISTLANLSPKEICNGITECLKLYSANKITDKNAFQLKMIDFLIYSLKHEDLATELNLNKASACLDASGKIYGFRVDRVHSEMMKVIGSKAEKRKNFEINSEDHSSDHNNNGDNNKKKKKRNHIIAAVESLKGQSDFVNPTYLIKELVEVQTSDMLLQANLPYHANQSTVLSYYKYVVLDNIELNQLEYTKLLVPTIHEFSNQHMCPSFSDFKFNSWSSSSSTSSCLESENENLDQNLSNLNNQFMYNSNSENVSYVNTLHESSGDRNVSKENQYIEDFNEYIENDPNPNSNYEYSYMQLSHDIEMIKPSHWKIKFNFCNGKKVDERIKKDKVFKLSFAKKSKMKAKDKFMTTGKSLKLLNCDNWDFNDLLIPSFYTSEAANLFKYFLKNTSVDKQFCGKNTVRNNLDSENDPITAELSNFFLNNSEENTALEQSFAVNFPDTFIPSNNGTFIKENLVMAQQSIEKIFVPYNKRAKKIDIKRLKNSIKSCLKIKVEGKIIPKEFSNVYLNLPKYLSKESAKSLTPALAFVSLLHVVHENRLVVKSVDKFCDVIIESAN